jgi:arylformamidase
MSSEERPSAPAVFATSSAATAAVSGSAASASSPARANGPKVWLDMDQQELDDAYDQIVYAPNRDQVAKRRIANSQRTLAVIGKPERVAYGPTEIEHLDIYRTGKARAPVSIFIHGGAWRANRAADYAFLTELFVNMGAHLIVLDFINVDDTGGNLFPMVEQVRRAVGWVYRNADKVGCDPDRLYLCSHSSGSHLGGCVVTSDWGKEGLPLNILKGAMLGSGMYDLKPVRLSKRSKYVRFTDEMEHELSAQRHLDRLNTPLILAHGTCETPEFQRQTRDFCAAVKAAGKPVELLIGEGYNHFEMLETLANPYGLLGRAVLKQMRLDAGG